MLASQLSKQALVFILFVSIIVYFFFFVFLQDKSTKEFVCSYSRSVKPAFCGLAVMFTEETTLYKFKMLSRAQFFKALLA